MTHITLGGASVAPQENRPVFEAMGRGFKGRCPRCGSGKLFYGFTKTVETCGSCGEEIHHHRADDLPAYLTIFVVGHIVVGGFMTFEALTDWPGWLHLSIWVPLTLILALALLQPIKGAVVGLQWANRMHGFGGVDEEALAAGADVSSHG